MNKRYFKEILRESNFGHTITIHKGQIFFVGCIDTYRVTGFCPALDECMNKCRNILDDMPDWLRKQLG